ncbi:MAG: hypothetical protein IKI80_05580, partial [Bacteroidaceae bacterium]|nr:hypothetical protein [Bacteroidaceae bacterium]
LMAYVVSTRYESINLNMDGWTSCISSVGVFKLGSKKPKRIRIYSFQSATPLSAQKTGKILLNKLSFSANSKNLIAL